MKRLRFFSSTPTLLNRVNQNVFALTLALFIIFSLVTLFVVYSLEDAVFKRQLQQTYNDYRVSGQLPRDFSLVADLAEFNLSQGEHLKYIEFDAGDIYNEFNYQQRHYHLMHTQQGILLFDTTDVRVVQRVIDEILLILLVMFIPCLWLARVIAKRTSRHAIRPFTQVCELFLAPHYDLAQGKAAIESIKEQDVRDMARALMSALENKSMLLEQQITFNQGMAHELRTPLQVMTHSIELLADTDASLANKPSFQRLGKSVTRMKRISEALLWLTAVDKQQHHTEISQVLVPLLAEHKTLTDTHNIEVQLSLEAEYVLPMPAVTLELIVVNLMANVIHHCQVDEKSKYWHIRVTEDHVSFINPRAPVQDNENEQTGARFGLGLMLVQKLATRFDVQLEFEQDDCLYQVRLKS